MTTAGIAALISVLFLGYAEGLRRFYPSKATWLRIRSRHGRRAAWAMRRRFEAYAEAGPAKTIAFVLLGLVILWAGLTPSLLDKRWYEVFLDVLPYLFISLALFRAPGSLRAVAERMKEYEKESGEDPDREPGDDPGSSEIAL